MDPDGFRNFNKHVYFPLVIEDPSLIDVMFPKTLDEIQAETENDTLLKEQYVPIQETDNHTSHIYSHMTLMPKTWALWFHLAEHQKALAQQKTMAQGQGGQQQQQKVAESIGFKDLPPEGQVQMAQQAGIKLDASQMQPLQTQQSSPTSPGMSKPMGKTARSPVAAASPLKAAIQSTNPMN